MTQVQCFTDLPMFKMAAGLGEASGSVSLGPIKPMAAAPSVLPPVTSPPATPVPATVPAPLTSPLTPIAPIAMSGVSPTNPGMPKLLETTKPSPAVPRAFDATRPPGAKVTSAPSTPGVPPAASDVPAQPTKIEQTVNTHLSRLPPEHQQALQGEVQNAAAKVSENAAKFGKDSHLTLATQQLANGEIGKAISTVWGGVKEMGSAAYDSAYKTMDGLMGGKLTMQSFMEFAKNNPLAVGMMAIGGGLALYGISNMLMGNGGMGSAADILGGGAAAGLGAASAAQANGYDVLRNMGWGAGSVTQPGTDKTGFLDRFFRGTMGPGAQGIQPQAVEAPKVFPINVTPAIR